MSLWAKSQQLPPDVIQKIRLAYGTQFPIEVRHFLSHWIEEKIWANIYHKLNQDQVSSLIESLFQEIERKASSFSESAELFLFKLQLLDAAKSLRLKYASRPWELYGLIRQGLATEYSLVLEKEVQNNSTLGIDQELEVLKLRTQETANELRTMENDQESYTSACREFSKVKTKLQMFTSQPAHVAANAIDFEQQVNMKMLSLQQQRCNLIEKIKDTIVQLELLEFRVIDQELQKWKRNQQLSANGVTFVNNLDTIQLWCEGLAELIWLTRQQAKRLKELRNAEELPEQEGVQDHLPHVMHQVNSLLCALVTRTFTIEKQPPQVIKTNSRFSTSVRLLVGCKLNVHHNPPQVIGSIISESRAASLVKGAWGDRQRMNETAGEILNGTGRMEYHQCTNKLILNLDSMLLEKVKRGEKRDTESVTDEKFSLLFRCQFTIGGEVTLLAWTCTLPVVVIVHNSQKSAAWATVTWDNAFAVLDRVPFEVTNTVPWSRVAEVLDTKFRAATGRSLTTENLDFLAAKAFRINSDHAPNQNYSSQILTWSAFAKDNLPERNFTFWEWFHSLLKLTRDHLQGPWKDGWIMGLVTRKQTEEMLADCSPGTFLMRFSESELGGISIAWVDDHRNTYMLQPFISKDFSFRTLADRISDFQHLTTLYPDVPKDHAFAKFYTPLTGENQKINGYAKVALVNRLPAGWQQHSTNVKQGMRTPPNSSISPESEAVSPDSPDRLYIDLGPDSSPHHN